MKHKEIVQNNNPVAFEVIKNAIENNKVAHAFLFSGQRNSDINDEPMFLIQSLISNNDINGQRNVASYPDFHELDGSENIIKKGDVINIAAKLQETALETGGKKILLIRNVENTNKQSLNSLLKFIEEPTKDTYIIMTTNNISQVLPTIRSRAQVISLRPLSSASIKNQLIEKGVKERVASVLSAISSSLEEALSINEDKFEAKLDEVIDVLQDALVKHDAIYSSLVNIIKKNNYKVYLSILRVFFNDVWKYKENIDTSFEEGELLDKYSLSSINFDVILRVINDFFVMQDYHVNFDLYKSQMLLKIRDAF